MLRKSLILVAGTSLIATGCTAYGTSSAAPVTASTQVAAKERVMTEGEKLKALFTASDEDNLKRNPISGIFRGDLRYADQFGDYISDEYIAGEKAAEERELAELQKIDRSKLSETDKIAYDVFEYNKKRALIGYSDEILALSNPRPVNHFSGFHTFYPNFTSGKGGAPFKTLVDYENNLKRHAGYIVLGDRAIERFREGIQSGVFETRLTIENVIEQLATQNELGLEKTPFMGPVRNLPEDFSEEDKTRLTAEYEEMTKKLFASNQRMHDFLKNEYLPYARTETGLNAMKGGELYYDYLIEGTTTLPLKAGEIHELGLKEVARIKTEMEAIKDEVGFAGTLSEFFEHFRTDPKFHPESREALTQGYYDLGKTVDTKISTQFKVLPKSPLEIRPYDKSI
ncbi:MAG: DUF885 domain-containing protein, partial [Pseudomonadota bacterium]